MVTERYETVERCVRWMTDRHEMTNMCVRCVR